MRIRHPALTEWDTVSPLMRHILIIEHEYVRAYVHTLAFEAVVARFIENSNNENSSAPDGRTVPGRKPTITPAALEAWYGGDRKHVEEAIDSSRSLLRTVAEGLYPGEHLKHAPVRTTFRIIAVAIILLKARPSLCPADAFMQLTNMLG